MTPDRTFFEKHPLETQGQLLERAIEEGRTDIVLFLLQSRNRNVNDAADVERYGSFSPFVTALMFDQKALAASIAVQPGFDVTKSLGLFESYLWARTCSPDTLRFFLSLPEVDVNARDGNGKAIIHEVVYDTSGIEKLEYLLTFPNIQIDLKQVDQTTPLYRAVLARNVDAVQLLIRKGADVNAANNDNHQTILMCAAAYHYTEALSQLLMTRRIRVNAQDELGNTALHIAVQRGFPDIVEKLLEHKDIDVNIKNEMGWTALSTAAFYDHKEIVKLLLKRGDIDVNAVDRNQQTALFQAASVNGEAAAALLLSDKRIDTSVRNRPENFTARQMAEHLGYEGVVNLFRQHDQGD